MLGKKCKCLQCLVDFFPRLCGCPNPRIYHFFQSTTTNLIGQDERKTSWKQMTNAVIWASRITPGKPKRPLSIWHGIFYCLEWKNFQNYLISYFTIFDHSVISWDIWISWIFKLWKLWYHMIVLISPLFSTTSFKLCSLVDSCFRSIYQSTDVAMGTSLLPDPLCINQINPWTAIEQ